MTAVSHSALIPDRTAPTHLIRHKFVLFIKKEQCDVQKECYMTFNVLLAVYVLFGMNENLPIEETNKMPKKYKKLLL